MAWTGGGLLHKARRGALGAVVLLALGLTPHSGASAQQARLPASNSTEMLDALNGLWAGQGTVRRGRGGPVERVDCTLLLDWSRREGRLEHTLSCQGGGGGVHASGYFEVSSGDVLTGYVNGSSIIGRAYATCEVKGRALHVTLSRREYSPRNAQETFAAEDSLWILLLNRGDRRLGTVIRAKEAGSGRRYEKLALNLRRVTRNNAAPPGTTRVPGTAPQRPGGPPSGRGDTVIER